jgi:hypothetical protein
MYEALLALYLLIMSIGFLETRFKVPKDKQIQKYKKKKYEHKSTS